METPVHDLASLLQPFSLAEFFANHWESKPLFIRRAQQEFQGAGYYRGLLENRDLEDIISVSDARYPAIRLAKDGAYFPPGVYTKDVTVGDLTFRGVPDVGRISAEYGKGASVALPALHRTWAPLSALCVRLEDQLDFLVHANAYLTPGRAAGFTPHYDTHDILVLQIAGKKQWRIDTPPIELPHSSQTFNPQGFIPGPRLLEIEVSEGDLLYLPRGYVHSTTTSDAHSAHVTIGINVHTWADVAIDLVPSCVEREEFRKALPPGFASRAELRPAMTERLNRMLPALSPDECDRHVGMFMDRTRAARPRVPPRFRADVVVVSPDSPMQAPATQQYQVGQSGESLVLDFNGRRYVFPLQIAAALHAMCTRATFRVRDLPESTDPEAALSFARFLQGIGFLRSST
jgi:bifunctional lysine-specific demethylase and histidyl-hydroxylase NO66